MDVRETLTEAAEDVARLIRHPKESTVTGTAQAPAQDAQAIPFWSALHQNLAVFTSRVDSFLPKIARIADAAAVNPVLDDVVEAALTAAGMGVAEEVFSGIVTLLKAAPDGQESAAFDLLKTVMHQPAAAPAKPQATFTPAKPADGTGAQQAAQARTAPAVV